LASFHGNEEIATALIEAGADVEIENENGYTALITAQSMNDAGYDRSKIIELINNASEIYQEYQEREIGDAFTQDANQSQFGDAIISLKTKKIINGYDDGTFKPFSSINRAEFIKIVIGATFPENLIEACTATHFSDVPADAWFNNYVCIAKTRNIIDGYSDDSFKPDQQINVAEALKITLKAFGIQTRETNNSEAWYAPFTEYARSNNYYLGTFNSDSKQLTREDMAELVYRIMENNQ